MKKAAIDLGTMNIKFGFYDPLRAIAEGEPEWKKIVTLNTAFNAAEMLKNIVSLRQGECHVGSAQVSRGWVSLYDVKQHLTEEAWVLDEEGHDKLTIMEVLEKEYGYFWNPNNIPNLSEAEEVVLTVPVNFTELQCRKMRKSAEDAGLPIMAVLTEPFAGLFGIENFLEELKDEFIKRKANGEIAPSKRILIVDIGAGTLDTCIFEMVLTNEDRLRIELRASKGCSLGGNCLSNWLYQDLLITQIEPALEKRVMSKIKRTILDNPAIPEEDKQEESTYYQKNLERQWKAVYNSNYRDKIEEIKKIVCIQGKTETNTPAQYDVESGVTVNVTYDQFSAVLDQRHVLEDLTAFMDELMKNAGFYDYDVDDDGNAKIVPDVSEIDQIVAIGGSSQVPYFQNFLKSYFALEGADETDRFQFSNNSNRSYNSVVIGAVAYMLSQEDGWYELVNRLAYEIGVIENGEYSCNRSMSITVGKDNEPALGAVVTPEAGEDGKPIVKLYQLFDNTQLDPWREVLLHENHKLVERAVYMGYFALDVSDFAVGTACKMKVVVDTDGTVYGRFCTDRSETYTKEYTLTMEV